MNLTTATTIESCSFDKQFNLRALMESSILIRRWWVKYGYFKTELKKKMSF